MDELSAELQMGSPKDNLQVRLKIRDDVLSKFETDIESIIDIFLSYQLDYFSVLQILSTFQYLRLCRKALNLPVTKPEHIAFINYSILSISLEAPITCQEYNDAVLSLRSIERSKIPAFLQEEIDEFYELINYHNEAQDPDTSVNQEDEETLYVDVSEFTSMVDMTSLFGKEPKDQNLCANAIKLHQSLLNFTSTDVLISQLSDATNEFTNFSTLLNYFSFQADIYQKFTNFILTIIYSSYLSDSTSVENISMFKKHFTISKASSYFLEICNIATKDYIEGFNPIPNFPSNFDRELSVILNLCSEFTNDPNYHILAAIQLSQININEAIAHFTLAITYNYSRSQKEINDHLAACGIELLIQDPNPKKRGYAASLYQFVRDEAILTVLTNNSMKLTTDDLLEAIPYFWNFEVLQSIMPDEKEQREFLLACCAKNIEEMDSISTFRELATMRLLNALNKEFLVSKLDVFNVDKPNK